MTHRQLKIGYFALAALNTIATSYFLNYLFFFLHDRYGFGDMKNLAVTALHGVVYVIAGVACGKFAQRYGHLLSLKCGFLGLAVAMVLGGLTDNLFALLGVVVLYSIVLLLIWPTLEALTSERETQRGVQQMVGIYNCTWAAAAALAYFTGGKLYDALGKTAIFWIPGGIFLLQFFLTVWLERHHKQVLAKTPAIPKESHHTPEAAAFHRRVNPQAFLKMAWLANPFAYIAINTLLAVMPGVAQQLGLSPTRVGLFCSSWFFGRLAAFALLWQWSGWHYRFRWLFGSFLLLIGSFGTILLARELWIVVLAQIFFGLATGLIYYSSLFYSMDVSQGSSEHGGWHEAFIGAGIFVGPAVGAGALYLMPQAAQAGTWAVSGLLVLGGGGLLWLRGRK